MAAESEKKAIDVKVGAWIKAYLIPDEPDFGRITKIDNESQKVTIFWFDIGKEQEHPVVPAADNVHVMHAVEPSSQDEFNDYVRETTWELERGYEAYHRFLDLLVKFRECIPDAHPAKIRPES